MNRRVLMTFLPILLLYSALSFYIIWNGSLYLAEIWPDYPVAWYWGVAAVIAFSYFLGRSKFKPRPLSRFLKVIGSYYFAVFEYAILLSIIADLLALVGLLLGIPASEYILVAGTVAAALLVILLAVGSWNAWVPIVRRYQVSVDKKAGDLAKLELVVASDLHLGNLVGNRHLDRLINVVNPIEPDLILLAGDVMDEDIEPIVRNRNDERLARLRARYGTFAVLGNHEYYGGHVDEFVGRMKASGIPVLQDETALVAEGRIQIAGRKDKTAESMNPSGRLSMKELVEGLNPDLPIIAMDHQPYQYAAAAEAGVDILVSGHTHRGQFAPNHWITRRLFELDWGYLIKGSMHAFVSSGFGTWGPPIRLASRSEIIHITVSFKGD
ncbi:metallophosphoesterase [Cohnella thailandensis]|uniref:Metallophosphoesterase n=1 Tax=Cohnella thailandensis TaxID=557557 RepID=A0A841T4K3_9BACL|nr:metallophosphoesterase [Cohnella thailandensis]MBB6637010.1 metallophosphoesterase [Cohnella thailandensis]MBP1973106.1 putative MPP superfamily phosphohydrolase [Cohnella thailandensis]